MKAEFINNSKNDTYKVEIRRNKDNALIADAFELAAGKSVSTLTLLEAPEFGNTDCTLGYAPEFAVSCLGFEMERLHLCVNAVASVIVFHEATRRVQKL